MLDLTQFLGTTSTAYSNFTYIIDGIPIRDSSASFAEISTSKIVLTGTFTFLSLKLIDAQLEIKDNNDGKTVTLGYNEKVGQPFIEQTYNYNVNGNELDLSLVSSTVHRANFHEGLNELVMQLMNIEKASINQAPSKDGVSGDTDTVLFAESTGMFKLTAQLAPVLK